MDENGLPKETARFLLAAADREYDLAQNVFDALDTKAASVVSHVSVCAGLIGLAASVVADTLIGPWWLFAAVPIFAFGVAVRCALAGKQTMDLEGPPAWGDIRKKAGSREFPALLEMDAKATADASNTV